MQPSNQRPKQGSTKQKVSWYVVLPWNGTLMLEQELAWKSIYYDQRGCSYFHFLFSKPYMHWVTYGISNLSRSTPRIIERSTLALSSGKRVSGMSRLVFCKRSWDRFPRASPRITLPECCSGPSASELPRRVSFFPGTPTQSRRKRKTYCNNYANGRLKWLRPTI